LLKFLFSALKYQDCFLNPFDRTPKDISAAAKIKPLVVDEIVFVISRTASAEQTTKNEMPANFLSMLLLSVPGFKKHSENKTEID